MSKISKKQQVILTIFLKNVSLSSSQAHGELLRAGEELSLVTVKRDLSGLVSQMLLIPAGSGRARSYTISALGRIMSIVDAAEYCAIDPDKRQGLAQFNFNFFPSFPAEVFTSAELALLEHATKEYHERTRNLPSALQKKELERLIIELSWKSSKIEGNTYTLLDTEKLILEHKEAPGHDRKEAVMILNHKDAFTFIRENAI